MIRRLLWIVTPLLVVVVFCAEWFFLFRGFEKPSRTVVFTVPPGRSVREIGKILESEGVLSPGFGFQFRGLARILGKQNKLRPGEYEWKVPLPPNEVLRRLLSGKTLLHKTTIPEGLTMKEISRILVLQRLTRPESFERLLQSHELRTKLRVPALSFEGFLFPNTYQFSKSDGPQKIIETMVAEFWKQIAPEEETAAKMQSFSLLQWITLASIIEKESSLPQEHSLISSVFHNRLKKRMRLQTDPTVIYGIENFNGNLTKDNLLRDTPYNTYTRFGLPPGPISNPGASAIHAAVFPATTDFLYFVAKKDGTHAFSSTYEEHLKNVAIYQLNKGSMAQKSDLR